MNLDEPCETEQREMAQAVEKFRQKRTLLGHCGALSPATHALVILADGDGMMVEISGLRPWLLGLSAQGELVGDFMEGLMRDRARYPATFAIVFVLSKSIRLGRAASVMLPAHAVGQA